MLISVTLSLEGLFICSVKSQKGKVVLLHTIEALGGIGGIAPTLP
jgi:hypothetical protein